MQRTVALLAFGAVAVCLAATTTRARDSQLSAGDQKFLKEAAIGGEIEVKLGKMAAQQGTSAAVRRFGQRMVDDHSKANHELMRLAETKGWRVPKEIDAAHQVIMEKLSKLSGSDFDTKYMSNMVKDHEEDVELFETEARDGQDPDLKAFAVKTLPVIKEHLRMAKEVSGRPEHGR
jgi:putative membrane protein